jgi:hypothetical protein
LVEFVRNWNGPFHGLSPIIVKNSLGVTTRMPNCPTPAKCLVLCVTMKSQLPPTARSSAAPPRPAPCASKQAGSHAQVPDVRRAPEKERDADERRSAQIRNLRLSACICVPIP